MKSYRGTILLLTSSKILQIRRIRILEGRDQVSRPSYGYGLPRPPLRDVEDHVGGDIVGILAVV